MNCPRCGGPRYIEIRDEVDIGVGTMTRLLGGDCEDCGQFGICQDCGSWPWVAHAPFCVTNVLKREDDQ